MSSSLSRCKAKASLGLVRSDQGFGEHLDAFGVAPLFCHGLAGKSHSHSAKGLVELAEDVRRMLLSSARTNCKHHRNSSRPECLSESCPPPVRSSSLKQRLQRQQVPATKLKCMVLMLLSKPRASARKFRCHSRTISLADSCPGAQHQRGAPASGLGMVQLEWARDKRKRRI